MPPPLCDRERRRPRVLVVTGPTACGKSAFAANVAARFGGTVINADSMQIYREVPILSAQPDAATQALAPHRLYGVRAAADACSALAWRDLAMAEIATARAAGTLPILVGGTGLYLRALLQGLVEIPDIPSAIRAAVRERQQHDPPAVLHAELARRDPVMAKRLDVADTQRVARALEVIEATGVSLASYQAAPEAGPAPVRALLLAALPPRPPLYRKIETRLDVMVQAGALDEVAGLLEQGLDPTLPAMKAVGVPQLARYVRGEAPLDVALADAKTATRRYAKRQLTWVRHQTPRDADTATFVPAQFSKRLNPVLFNEIRAFLLTAQP